MKIVFHVHTYTALRVRIGEEFRLSAGLLELCLRIIKMCLRIDFSVYLIFMTSMYTSQKVEMEHSVQTSLGSGLK